MRPAAYLATVFAILAGLCAVTIVYAWTEMGRETGNGFANCAYIARKTSLAERMDTPKLLIIGGSNAAAGIDATALAAALRVNAFNYSLFATFSPGFDLFQARKVLKPGDAVLLAFEYLAYEYESPTNALVDTVYSCGQDFWRSLDWPQRLRFVFAVRPQRFFSTLRFDGQIRQRALNMVDAAIAPDGNLGNPLPGPTPETGDHEPLIIRYHPRSNGVRQVGDFVRWAKANQITVFATWPNTLYFEQYEPDPVFADIADFYASVGVTMIGHPRDAMVSSEYLADTIYHLTAPGIALRTKKLSEALMQSSAFSAWQVKVKADPIIPGE